MGVPGEAGGVGGRGKRGVGVDVRRRIGRAAVIVREDKAEVFVELNDEIALGAEVCGETERGEGNVAKASGGYGMDKALDARLAEEIDGLVRVPNEEDGLRVAVPGLGEEFEEFVLAGGSVLHLVDQEMLEARAECGGEIFCSGFFAESVAGEQADFSEVALVALGEDQLKFDESAAENAKEGFGDGPLI
jgi:hypothetical protein